MIEQIDRDAAAAFFRDERTGLSVKFNLGHDPSPLLEALAAHRQAAEKAAYAAGMERGWRDGWSDCKSCLSNDDTHELTVDVEEDAWSDSAICAEKDK